MCFCYLSECVINNKYPIAAPDVEYAPSLTDWVLCLKRAPNIDGTWKQTAKKWKERFYIDHALY